MFYCESCNKLLEDDYGLCERCFGLLPTGRWFSVDGVMLVYTDGYYNGYGGKLLTKMRFAFPEDETDTCDPRVTVKVNKFLAETQGL
jgi:hypothetical protein